jgi:nitroreductase
LADLGFFKYMKLINSKPNAWDIVAEDFPMRGMPVEKWKFLLAYATLAPSSHNSQPWLFHIQDSDVELYADRRRACRRVDPQDRELIMSCGCALFNLRVAMRHFGCLGDVEIMPKSEKSDLLARLSLGEQSEVVFEKDLLFRAIQKRRTNRQPFRSEPLPHSLLSALQVAADKESATLTFATDQEVKQRVADLIAEGDRRQWANKAFREELAKWVHANHSKRPDGIPGYACGVSSLMSYAGPLVVRTFDMGDGQAASNHELATGSPALGVLATDGDSARHWLAAGQALARVLLRARVDDVWASFLNQPIEVPSLRMNLPHVIGRPGFPQTILRLGFGDDINPTPRRKVEDVLV